MYNHDLVLKCHAQGMHDVIPGVPFNVGHKKRQCHIDGLPSSPDPNTH